jgi:glyoxylase-like metal-dependent hydrolase (beta-lactamase superfamily II)
VLVAGFPAGSWGTNCYLVAPGKGQECVVVDPGQDAARGVEELVRENGLKPVAVLLTHGHLDHMWSVVPVCGAHDIPAYVHPEDRVLLSDPGRGLSGETLELLSGVLTAGTMTFTEPDDVRELAQDTVLSLAGLEITVAHAPGHTRGSVTFATPGDGEEPPVLFSGDLLFRGGVGRTDLPGGSYDELLASLGRVCLPLPDETLVLSGHGAESSIGHERATNPWLQQLAPARAPERGQ